MRDEMQTASDIGLGRLSAADQAGSSHLEDVACSLLYYLHSMYRHIQTSAVPFLVRQLSRFSPPFLIRSDRSRMATTHTHTLLDWLRLALFVHGPIILTNHTSWMPCVVGGGLSDPRGQTRSTHHTDCIISRPLQSSVRRASEGRNNKLGRLVKHIFCHRPEFLFFFFFLSLFFFIL